ncbi:DUF1902 domain-containing protein [uncultured Paracoccus sp.]|uniref:DUF1902 domain-containing protein n=1 Tax=uncultured Paracoccus sp. TaxID=189685 RepID=UPI0025982511|nr:DUF1902 domain-containing protein [uncultured Paracoccus sp.]
MSEAPIVVKVGWDGGAGVWVATSDDVRGLAVEADDFAKLNEKVKLALYDLIELNGFPHKGDEIPLNLVKEDTLSFAECA